MHCLLPLFALCAMPLGNAAFAETAGLYHAAEGPEVAADLLLRPDGTYEYALAVGALDEASRGSWREDGDVIRFTTEPKPVPPEFRLKADAPADDDTYLKVSWPNGRGIAGVDFLITFDEGDPIEGYTQSDGWQWPPDEKRVPRSIELSEPIHRLASPRVPIAPGVHALRFELVPNDFGVIDLSAATAARDGERLILQRTDGQIKFVKTPR